MTLPVIDSGGSANVGTTDFTPETALKDYDSGPEALPGDRALDLEKLLRGTWKRLTHADEYWKLAAAYEARSIPRLSRNLNIQLKDSIDHSRSSAVLYCLQVS